MKQTVFDFKHIHFIGVGGASMSGLAKYCLTKGFSVSGSDKTVSNETKKLTALGAKVFNGHKAENVIGAELVVYSSAVSDDNPELFFAKKHGLPILKRSELLGEILSLSNKTVAVSGSHGKSTTTAMIAEIFIAANLNPTVFLGGERKTFGNCRVGGRDYAVAEACEYKRNFLDIHPEVAVILNIDNDHVDTYKNMDEAVDAFSLFAKNSLSVVNADDQYARKVFNSSTVTFGVKTLAVYRAKYISKSEYRSFTVYAYGKRLGRINLKIAGAHNVYNALAAVACASELKVPFSVIKSALEDFDGIKRRNEYLGEFCGVKCFADYAHHPTEIRAALESARDKVLVVFQPHTFSRTEALMSDFVAALSKADGVIIYKTYPAREKFSAVGDGKRLFQKLRESGKENVIYAGGYSSLKQALKTRAVLFDRILFLGAGDIYEIAKKCLKHNFKLFEKIRKKAEICR